MCIFQELFSFHKYTYYVPKYPLKTCAFLCGFYNMYLANELSYNLYFLPYSFIVG